MRNIILSAHAYLTKTSFSIIFEVLHAYLCLLLYFLQLTELFSITLRWTEEWIMKVFCFLNVTLDADFPEIIPSIVDFLVSKSLKPNYINNVFFVWTRLWSEWLELDSQQGLSFCHCMQTITRGSCIHWVSGMFPWGDSGQGMDNFTWIFLPNIKTICFNFIILIYWVLVYS